MYLPVIRLFGPTHCPLDPTVCIRHIDVEHRLFYHPTAVQCCSEYANVILSGKNHPPSTFYASCLCNNNVYNTTICMLIFFGIDYHKIRKQITSGILCINKKKIRH